MLGKKTTTLTCLEKVKILLDFIFALHQNANNKNRTNAHKQPENRDKQTFKRKEKVLTYKCGFWCVIGQFTGRFLVLKVC